MLEPLLLYAIYFMLFHYVSSKVKFIKPTIVLAFILIGILVILVSKGQHWVIDQIDDPKMDGFVKLTFRALPYAAIGFYNPKRVKELGEKVRIMPKIQI